MTNEIEKQIELLTFTISRQRAIINVLANYITNPPEVPAMEAVAQLRTLIRRQSSHDCAGEGKKAKKGTPESNSPQEAE